MDSLTLEEALGNLVIDLVGRSSSSEVMHAYFMLHPEQTYNWIRAVRAHVADVDHRADNRAEAANFARAYADNGTFLDYFAEYAMLTGMNNNQMQDSLKSLHAGAADIADFCRIYSGERRDRIIALVMEHSVLEAIKSELSSSYILMRREIDTMGLLQPLILAKDIILAKINPGYFVTLVQVYRPEFSLITRPYSERQVLIKAELEQIHNP